MAIPRTTITKRQRELAKQEKKERKAQRRAQRAEKRQKRAEVPNSEDPDIAGIVPGPQPVDD